VIQQYNLDINTQLWLARLQSPSVQLKRDGDGPEYHYHTPRDLHTRPDFTPLIAAIHEQIPGYEFIDCWGNLMTYGNYRTLHDHRRSETGVSLCFCLYLTEGSALVFPREDIAITPRPGLLVTFPPDRLHRVEPSGLIERWSVAGNLRTA
jgi:hypothetical protein